MLGEVWFEVPREDVSKVRKGVISGAEEVVAITVARCIWIKSWWEGWEEVVGEGEGGWREQ